MNLRVRPKIVFGGVLASLLVALAYLASAKFGFTMASGTKQVTAVWPPTGIALAALLLWGNRVWPGIFIGAFASNVLSSEPAWTAAAIAGGNTLAPMLGAFLLRRFAFRIELERVRDVLLFTLLASAAMLVSATNGVTSLALARIVPWNAFFSVWWVWWTGDAMGALLVTPPLLTWMTALRNREREEPRGLELASFVVSFLTVSWISFASNFPLRLSVYPFIIWVALRFRPRETTLASLVVCAIAVWATVHDLGPWRLGPLDARLIQVDSWMASLALTGLTLGAVSAERRAARVALQGMLQQTRRSVETLQAAFLPEHLPQNAGLRCDAFYIAAEREGLIGGDWYDGFALPDGRFVFSIGDVAGHGLDAAVTAVRLRQGIFAAAFDAESPGEILATVAHDFGSQQDALATAVVGIVSPDLKTLSYAIAGHPPPILAGPTMPVRQLEYGGIPLGAGTPVEWVTHEASLEPGGAILFYTDGLTEFARDIARAETAVMKTVTRLVEEPHIERPAEFVQRSVMGTRRPPDDTVVLVVRIGAALRQTWSYDSNDPRDAHALRREIAAFLRLYAVSEDELFGAELVIGEVFANTVEHAPGSVRVEVNWTAVHPVVTVWDAGPGLSRLASALPRDPLNENGRGIFLIHALALDVSVETREETGTKMRIVLPVDR